MKQKIIDYIEELERKAQDSEKYFKLWHEEYHKNKQAIEYIEDENIDVTTIRFNDIQDVKKDLLDILKGVDKE